MPGLTIPFTGLQKQYNTLRTEILDATDTVLRSGQLMQGNYTAEFENWLSKRNHSKYAVTCHSGTQALEIIAEFHRTHSALPNPPRVVVPAMTYVATANAFIRAGWEIYIADTDSHGLLDIQKIPPDLSVQAIVLVGLYGAAVDADRFWATDLIIEDGAQHWLGNGSTRVGSATALSFDPMKNLNAYGNGGAVVTNDHNLAWFAQEWINNGKPKHSGIGTNSRMSEIETAQLLVKTRYIDAWQLRRKNIVSYWLERLKKSGIRTLIDSSNFETHCYHKFVIDVDNRDVLASDLTIRGIETRIHYRAPLHELPAYIGCTVPDLLSAASALARRVLSLPLYPELTDLEVEYVIDSLLDCASTKHNWPTKPNRSSF
jgi:dTDP-4-amino-4,6-dideoxygalactose transaminase